MEVDATDAAAYAKFHVASLVDSSHAEPDRALVPVCSPVLSSRPSPSVKR